MQWISENSNLLIGLTFFLVVLFKGRIMAMIYKIPNLSAAELKSVQKDQNITLIDVRTPSEFNDNHANGAINLPLADFNQEKLVKIAPDKSKPLYLICASGNRSLWAAITLKKWGYQSPVNISGGMLFYNRV
jgi:rhodanese-related sulfurtransferase